MIKRICTLAHSPNNWLEWQGAKFRDKINIASAPWSRQHEQNKNSIQMLMTTYTTPFHHEINIVHTLIRTMQPTNTQGAIQMMKTIWCPKFQQLLQLIIGREFPSWNKHWQCTVIRTKQPKLNKLQSKYQNNLSKPKFPATASIKTERQFFFMK